MSHALQRFSAAIFGWIPDITGIPPRRQATLGVSVSVVLHLVAVLFVAWLISGQPQPQIGFKRAKIRPRTIELTIEPPEPEPIVPFTMAPPVQPFMDSRGLQIAPDAALEALFQSDENMRAASELAASGNLPLPSQAGRDLAFNAFTTQQSFLGAAKSPQFPPAPDAAPPEEVTAAPASTAPNAPLPTLDAAIKEALAMVEMPRDDEIVLSARAFTPAPPEKPVTQIEPVPTPPLPEPPAATPLPAEPKQAMLTKPAPPRPRPARESGYQPQQEQNRIDSNITNRGKKAVDARATPLAKYRKQVNDAIGSRWYFYIKPKMDLIAAGSVRISFAINEQGRVSGIQIDSNTSNQSFAEVCERAVREAEIAPPPPDAVAPLKDGRLECTLTFTFYNL